MKIIMVGWGFEPWMRLYKQCTPIIVIYSSYAPNNGVYLVLCADNFCQHSFVGVLGHFERTV